MSEARVPEQPGHRLHPSSLAFELLVQARHLVPLLIGTLLASGSDRYSRYFLFALLALIPLLALHALIQVLTTRYWISDREIVLREGLLFKRVRHIPFERIQNVLLQQSLLHRPFGVFTVRLETGSGGADADLRVLGAEAARRIEAATRGHGDVPVDAAASQDRPALLQLGTGEVLLAGLVLDRGFLIVAAALVGVFQLDLPMLDLEAMARQLVTTLLRWAGGLNAWSLGLLLLGFLLLTKLLTLLLSVLQALLLWHGFRLEQDGPRLLAQSGLLNRARASATPARVQILSIHDGIWLRLLRRRAVAASVSGANAGTDSERGLDWLAPIVPEQHTEALLQATWPGLDLRQLQWQPLHPATHARLARRSLLLHLLLGVAVSLWSLKLLPLVIVLAAFGQIRAWAWTRLGGYAFDGKHLAWRSGISQRTTWIVPIAAVSGCTQLSSPFDRRHRSADLLLDTQAPQRTQTLRLRYLPVEQARELARRLRHGITDTTGLPAIQSTQAGTPAA